MSDKTKQMIAQITNLFSDKTVWAEGGVVEVSDFNNRVTVFYYDAEGNPLWIIHKKQPMEPVASEMTVSLRRSSAEYQRPTVPSAQLPLIEARELPETGETFRFYASYHSDNFSQ